MLKMKVAPNMLLKTNDEKLHILTHPNMYMKTKVVIQICQYVFENKRDRCENVAQKLA